MQRASVITAVRKLNFYAIQWTKFSEIFPLRKFPAIRYMQCGRSVTSYFMIIFTYGHECQLNAIICDHVWEKGTFRAKIEFLISGTRG